MAADQARVAAAEAAKKAPIIAEISAALGNPDPADLLLFVNEGNDVPNLAKNLDGELVSATGKLSVCHTEIVSPYAGARGQRYEQLVADFLATALPSGAEPSSVDLEHCGSRTPVDAIYFQLGQLEATPLKFVQYLGKSLNASLIGADAFSLQDAENAEAAIVAAQQKSLADKAALKKATLENIRSGTADGFGFVIVKGTSASLCYFDGGELSAVMDENIEPVLQQLLSDDAIYAEVNKLNNSLKPLNSLDEIYIGMTRKPPTCGWMFGNKTSLQKIAAAMDRDAIAFDTLPYWATAEDIVPFSDAAKIEQKTMAEAKAAQEAEAALAAEKQAAEERAAQQKAAEQQAAEQKQEAERQAAEAEAAKQSKEEAPTQQVDSSSSSYSSGNFDSTGLVNLENTGTLVASCFFVSTYLRNATSFLKQKMYDDISRSSDAEYLDGLNNANKLSKGYDAYASIGDSYAKEWGNNNVLYVPNNERSSFGAEYNPARQRVEGALSSNPIALIDAFEFCRANVY